MAVAIARALQEFKLPNIKPFNCQPCLSFWIAVLIYSYIDWKLIPLAFVSYLIAQLIIIYECK